MLYNIILNGYTNGQLWVTLFAECHMELWADLADGALYPSPISIESETRLAKKDEVPRALCRFPRMKDPDEELWLRD